MASAVLAAANSNVADSSHLVAELGKPLRPLWGKMKPMCRFGGRQWLLGPMWVMNIVTLLLILVPGFFWFQSVWHTRTMPEKLLLAPGLFIATLASYAYTSWVDPGIVQPGHFNKIEDSLIQASSATAAEAAETLLSPEEDLTYTPNAAELGTAKMHRISNPRQQKWDYNPRRDLSYKLWDCNNNAHNICPICGVPQPSGKQVVHVSYVCSFTAALPG